MKRIFVLLLGLVLAGGLRGQIEEPLKYDVKVSVRVIPLFAVNAKGEPVFDLKAEDLVFKINDKTVVLDYLLKRDFQSEKTETSEVAKQSQPALPPSERIVFILLDRFNIDSRSERRQNEIARSLITMGQPYDRYVVFSMQPQYGLQYVAGPEAKSEALLDKIEKSRTTGRIAPALLYERSFFGGGPGDSTDPEYTGLVGDIIGTAEKRDKGLGQMQCVSYLKYALKTVVQPKIVYYISTGFAVEIAGKRDTNREFNILAHIIQSFREGGASVFAINPLVDKSKVNTEESRQMLAKLAQETGGKLFEGPQVREIMEKVEKSNRAYYEAVVNVRQFGAAPEYEIKVECRRPGVQILAPGTIIESKKYIDMNDAEKEIFAADAASSGFWARMQTRIKRAPFSGSVTAEKEGFRYKLTVAVPQQMAGQDADIFLIRAEGKSGATTSQRLQRMLANREILELSGRSGDRLYFAILTQSGVYCICGSFISDGNPPSATAGKNIKNQ